MRYVKDLVMVLAVFLCMVVPVSAQEFDYSKLSETLLNQDPDPVEPGEYVELRFKVVKEGNEELENIEYELVPEYPFSVDKSDSAVKEVGDWRGNSDENEYYILYYKLRVDEDALEDTYELKLLQRSENGLEREVEFDVRVDEKKSPELVIGRVDTSPSKLIANYDEGVVRIEFVNVGDEAAEQVIVDMDVPKGFEESFGYSSRANLGTIDAGESKIGEFYLDTNKGLEKGNHGAQLSLSYKEDDDGVEDDIKEIKKGFNISVFGRPEYELKEVYVDNLTTGSSGEIKLKVENIGSRESDSTSLQIFMDSSQPFEFDDKSEFIGKMDVNSMGEAVFNIEVDDDAKPKEYKLKLQVRSVVDQEVLVEDEIVEVNVNKRREVGILGSDYFEYSVYLILLIVGLIVGYRLGIKGSRK